MNIIKTLRKPYLSIFLAILIIFTSCSGDEFIDNNELEKSQSKFDFSFFNKNQDNLIDMKSFKLHNKSSLSRLEVNNIILTEINDQLGSELDFSTSFKELELDSFDSVSNWIYTNQSLNELDMQILIDFDTNLKVLELTDAIAILENDVNNANLNSFKIDKFEYLANVVKLIENETPGFFTTQQKSCWGATIGLAFAAGALALACNPPALGATVGAACYLAGANFIRASIMLGLECGDD